MPNGLAFGYEDQPYPSHYGYWPSMIEKKLAPHLGHSKHLCYMADLGVDLQTVKDLVRNPKFICKKCGRAAAKEENLCEPVPL